MRIAHVLLRVRAHGDSPLSLHTRTGGGHGAERKDGSVEFDFKKFQSIFRKKHF